MIINHLSEIMGKKRLKVSDVVAATGLSYNTVSFLYNDKVKRADFETLNKLMTFLELKSTNELLEYIPDSVVDPNNSNDSEQSAEKK